MRRIINNKRIELTDDEFKLYQEICKSYDRPNFKGSDLFVDLFETDENGIITFLKPPTQFTSMEVFLFMMSVFCHQHVRQMYDRTDDICLQLKEKIKKADELISDLESRRASQ